MGGAIGGIAGVFIYKSQKVAAQEGLLALHQFNLNPAMPRITSCSKTSMQVRKGDALLNLQNRHDNHRISVSIVNGKTVTELAKQDAIQLAKQSTCITELDCKAINTAIEARYERISARATAEIKNSTARPARNVK